jgi:hypothetical protein
MYRCCVGRARRRPVLEMRPLHAIDRPRLRLQKENSQIKDFFNNIGPEANSRDVRSHVSFQG